MLIYILGGVTLLFCLVVFFGAPYLPTMKSQAQAALDLLDLRRGDTLLELGCGDGRIMRLAAQKGLNVVGYELNPLLCVVAYIVTFKHRNNVRIIWGDFWKKDLPPADGVFVFLIDRYMDKLNTKMNQYPHKPVKLASFAFKVPGKKVVKQKDGVHLYIYP